MPAARSRTTGTWKIGNLDRRIPLGSSRYHLFPIAVSPHRLISTSCSTPEGNPTSFGYGPTATAVEASGSGGRGGCSGWLLVAAWSFAPGVAYGATCTSDVSLADWSVVMKASCPLFLFSRTCMSIACPLKGGYKPDCKARTDAGNMHEQWTQARWTCAEKP